MAGTGIGDPSGQKPNATWKEPVACDFKCGFDRDDPRWRTDFADPLDIRPLADAAGRVGAAGGAAFRMTLAKVPDVFNGD